MVSKHILAIFFKYTVILREGPQVEQTRDKGPDLSVLHRNVCKSECISPGMKGHACDL